MRAWAIAGTLAAAATAATAGDFHLIDPASGRRLGPFDFVQGSTVEVAGVAYRLEKIDQAAVMTDRLRKIVIPSIEFRQANLQDVLAFLVDASRKYDPTTREGMNLVVHGPGEQVASDPNDPFGPAPAPPVTITLSLRKVPLLDALRYVSEIADLEMTVDKDRVVLRPRAAAPARPDGPPAPGPRSEGPATPPALPDRPR